MGKYGYKYSFWKLCFFNYGSGRDYNCGLKYIFVWGVKQHTSIGEFSAGEEYIMRGDL